MTKSYRQILGNPVLHFEQGTVLGVVRDVIIHPDTGRLEGLWIKPTGRLLAFGVLQTQDIVEWKKNIYVKDEGSIAEAHDVIKISEILADGRLIMGKRVRTEAGETVGRVVNLDFDTEQYYLRHLYTQKSVLGLWAYDSRILNYDLILEVLPDYILIKDKTAKAEKIKVPLIKEKDVLLDPQ